MSWENLEATGMAALLFLTAIGVLLALGLCRMTKSNPLPPLHFGDEDGASARTIEDDLRDVA